MNCPTFFSICRAGRFLNRRCDRFVSHAQHAPIARIAPSYCEVLILVFDSREVYTGMAFILW
jgi:hypothetical protein